MILANRAVSEPFQAITAANLPALPVWKRIPVEMRESIQVVSQVIPFRTNEYVVRELIDWSRVPDDPIFQLTFPQRAMLDPEDYREIRDLLQRGAPKAEIVQAANRIRLAMNPHPGGQREYNVPQLGGAEVPGLQHKYRETVLFFPRQGQTCHAYCTYCFRWAQFVNMPDLRFEASETETLVAYLKAHPEVSDVLITGGDPMIMSARTLRRYIEPLLAPELEHVRTIRIGTKAPAYWPQRFVTDPDADDVLCLFEDVVRAGRHLAFMSHYSHHVELRPEIARECVRRIRSTGAEIRTQAPVVRHVNDHPDVWVKLCNDAVGLGMVPYYFFVERDTGPKSYFELPLVEAHEIFLAVFRRLPGLARTLRGPIMSATQGKIRILGATTVLDRTLLLLDFLQARDPSWVGRPFFAEMDARATWIDQLSPAFESDRPFFQLDPLVAAVTDR
jgi:KamA family protein